MFEEGTILGWLESHSLLIVGFSLLAWYFWTEEKDKRKS